MITRAQAYMKEHAIDGWLLYDFRGSNPVFWRMLNTQHPTSRRNYLWIPAEGEALLFLHNIDKLEFSGVDLPVQTYVTWQEMGERLRGLMQGCSRVAMEYSPGAAIPMHSFVDAGTVELVRALGFDVVSSANLFQYAATAWSKQSVALHAKACTAVNEVKDLAFARIGELIGSGQAVTEYDIQQFIRQQFDQRDLMTDHGPIVAVNAHSGDPHFEPSAETHSPIHKGDWVLIDLWAKYRDPEAVYCDITWTGFVGSDVPSRHQEVFNIVTGARDAVVKTLQDAWASGTPLQGWQLDRAARDHIESAGYGAYFGHRTGHSMGISPSAHALGMNLDDLETHDTRAVLPGIGFSVEPGIYLPEFGVRSEIDMQVDPEKGPVVTTSIQREVIRMLG